MKHQRTPLSERVEAACDDAGLVSEIQALERVASAGVAHVAANGKFPHWPLDRWITVLGFVGVLIGGIWFAGGKWAGMERDVADLKTSVVRLTDAVERDRANTSALMQVVMPLIVEPVSAEPLSPSSPARRRPSMAFPRSEQLDMTRGRQ